METDIYQQCNTWFQSKCRCWAATQPWPYHIMEKYTPTVTKKISLFPPFPIPPSGKSVPEWHLIIPLCTGALSGTNGLHYLGKIFAWSNCSFARHWSHWCLRNTGESVSDQLHALNWSQKAHEAEEEVQGVPHHRSLPMHALFCYQRLYPYHLNK